MSAADGVEVGPDATLSKEAEESFEVFDNEDVEEGKVRG